MAVSAVGAVGAVGGGMGGMGRARLGACGQIVTRSRLIGGGGGGRRGLGQDLDWIHSLTPEVLIIVAIP